MSNVWLSIAVKSPNRLVTPLNWISGLAAGSFQGSKTDWFIPAPPQEENGPREGCRAGRKRALGARFDLGPEARHDALSAHVVRLLDIGVIKRRLGRVDRRIVDHVLVE